MTSRKALWPLLAVFAFPLPCFAGEPPVEPILRFETGNHGAMINRISTDAEGRSILTCSDDKTARLWDRDGALLATYRVPIGEGNEGKLFACSLSPDGSLAAVGGWTGSEWDSNHCVYVLDSRSGEILKRLTGLGNIICDLSFSRDGRYLACGLGGKNGIRLWDTTTWKEAGRDADYGDDSYGVAFWQGGGATLLAATSYDGSVRLYRLEQAGLKRLSKLKAVGGKRPFAVAFSPDGRLLACGLNEDIAVDVYEVTSQGLRFSFAPDTKGIDNGDISSVSFSADGRILVAGGQWDRKRHNPLRRWTGSGRGSFTDIETPNFSTVMDVKPLPDGGFLYGAGDPAWGIVSADGKPLVARVAELAELGGQRESFRVSADGSRVAFGYAYGGAAPAVFDVASASLTLNGGTSGLAAADTEALPVADWANTASPTLGGKPLTLEQYETSRCIAVLPDHSGFVLGADWHLRLFAADGKEKWELHLPEVPWAVNVSGDGRLVLAAIADGTIRWYRASDGKELAALFLHGDRRRWVMATASGSYDCSPGGEDLMGWHVNKAKDAAADFFPASRFRAAFYRPDVVRLTLSMADEKAALAEANSGTARPQAASITTMLPPVVRIVSPEQGARITASPVRVQYRVKVPSGETLKTVRVLVDGRPVQGARGLNVTGAAGTGSLDVPIPGQDCTVSLIAETAGASSEAAAVRLVWAGAKAEPFVIKPRLYVLAVGVSAYQKDELRLRYAAKDARDFAAVLSGQKGTLYRDVTVKVLTDGDATRDEIMDGLDWIQKETTSKDLAAVFLAGHGVNDPNGIYYYLPANADTERLKRTGVPFSDIRNTVQGIAGKVLFFVDTCHAGNVMGGRRGGGPDMTAVVNELSSAENGAVVFSSSTGSQYSLEDPAWGNGAFTKAVVEGLRGKADYTGAGRITVNMLDLYISERVKELTRGKQTPTTMKPPSVPDFPIAVK